MSTYVPTLPLLDESILKRVLEKIDQRAYNEKSPSSICK